MRRLLLAIAALFWAATIATTASTTAWAEPVTVTFVHVNDLDRMEGTGYAGGPARLAAVVNELREAGGTVIVTNGGDTISPSLLSSFDRGAHMIDLLNMVGLDAMVLGNHEFDFGPDVTRARIAEADFPVLSSNALEPDGSLIDGVTDHLMIEAGGYTIGMFGLTTAGTAYKSSPGDVTFSDPVEVAAAKAAELREAGADFIVALAHTDLAEDAALFAAGDADLILSGDDHILAVRHEGGPVLVESGSQAEFVTVITVTMDMVEGRSGPELVWTPSFELINTTGAAADPDVAAKVGEYEARLSAELDIEIGTTEAMLDSRRTSVRSGETGLGNLIADAMRMATGADVALTNGGGIRGDRTYDAGTVLTRRDMQTELPFGNRTVVIEIDGAALAAALEHGVSGIEDGAGRFPHISGMAFVYDPEKPAGERVVSASVGGEPLDLSKTYRLATNDFMARGGDGYSMFAGAPAIVDANAGELMVAQVIRHIEQAGTVAPEAEGRVTVAE